MRGVRCEVLRRLIVAIGRILDAILPGPPDADFAADEEAAGARRRRIGLRLKEKQGRGGYR